MTRETKDRERLRTQGRNHARAGDTAHPDGRSATNGLPTSPALGLVRTLCDALETEEISYCHWKSNNALDRSANGENDLDLLVSRADVARFTAILGRLGFKRAEASILKRLPGVEDYFGYDAAADELIHVHAHYQLVLGHDMTKNYRLPVEEAYLGSAEQRELFRVPAVEFELVVFVVRMLLKHGTWDVILGGQGRLKPAEREELDYLRARATQRNLDDILAEHLPSVDERLFDDCLRALRPDASAWRRATVARRLQARLRPHARRSAIAAVGLRYWRRARLAVRRRLFNAPPRYRLTTGGAMIALVGGDGAGKSTAIDGIDEWLSRFFPTRTIHLGKPDWSWTTLAVRAVLKIGNLVGLYPVEVSYRETLEQASPVSTGYPWLLREVCRARDRYKTYLRARRIAVEGGLAILDRFPVPRVTSMDGPRTARFLRELGRTPAARGRLSPRRSEGVARTLVRLEESYYRRIARPGVLVVLRLDPDIAVRRRPDEDPSFVRRRNAAIRDADWDGVDATVIDASQPKADVLAAIKALVWSRL